MPQAEPRCVICDTALTHLQAQLGKTCGQPMCQLKWRQLPPEHACLVCGKPLPPWRFGIKTCPGPQCQLALDQRRHQERQQREREAIERQGLALRTQGAASLGIAQPEKYSLTVIPAYTAPVVNLPERRRRAFRDRLNLLLSQATDQQFEPPPQRTPLPMMRKPAPGMDAVLGQACATCKGHCCRDGGDHAYLRVQTLRRYLAAHPEQRPRQVLQAYLDRIPQRSHLKSCIFHGPQGCTLTREMRSDTCNLFFCPELRSYQYRTVGADGVRGFFMAVRNQAVHAAAFIDEHACQPVPISDPT